MIFSSMLFLWLFLPMILLIYFISNNRFKNVILFIGSLIFYAWGEPKYCILMIFSIIVNYFIGLLMDKYNNKKILFLILGIIINLGLLFYFKYFNFAIELVNGIFGTEILSYADIALPIGISFYTFQILSYIIDLYKGKIKVQKNFLNLALYISFFPQLIAGPIVRYQEIEKEISDRKVDITLFVDGIRRFVYGLSKKVLLSNSLALATDNILRNNICDLNTPIAWLAAICYTLQIYFDFSGYSDMAIGLGKMFGFHFPENFNLPYVSRSITEFWRRWHITLSTWFKEYLYIPLGGNKKGRKRQYINLLIVFFATGLWHGASLNFIVWGLYYGVFLILEKLFLLKWLNNNKIKIINNLYVIIIVIIGWMFFRIDGLNNAIDIIELMFSFNFDPIYIILPSFINIKIILIILISILFAGPIQVVFSKHNKNDIIRKVYKKIEFIVIGILMILCISELVASSYNPFIYFRF